MRIHCQKAPRPFAIGSESLTFPKQNSHILDLSHIRPSSTYQQSHDTDVVDTLLAKNNELQQRIDTLQTKIDRLHQDKSLLKSQLKSTRSQLREERLTSAELEIKTQELRAVLIPVSETQLSDGEVVSKFTSLRSQILKLVKSTWRRDNFKPGIELTKNHTAFLGPFMEGKVDMRYLDNRVRSIIFEALHACILGKRCYHLDENLTHLEGQVGEFEDWMWKRLPTGKYLYPAFICLL